MLNRNSNGPIWPIICFERLGAAFDGDVAGLDPVQEFGLPQLNWAEGSPRQRPPFVQGENGLKEEVQGARNG